MPHLFEPFARGNDPRNVEGTGLGLTIVRGLVQKPECRNRMAEVAAALTRIRPLLITTPPQVTKKAWLCVLLISTVPLLVRELRDTTPLGSRVIVPLLVPEKVNVPVPPCVTVTAPVHGTRLKGGPLVR